MAWKEAEKTEKEFVDMLPKKNCSSILWFLSQKNGFGVVTLLIPLTESCVLLSYCVFSRSLEVADISHFLEGKHDLVLQVSGLFSQNSNSTTRRETICIANQPFEPDGLGRSQSNRNVVLFVFWAIAWSRWLTFWLNARSSSTRHEWEFRHVCERTWSISTGNKDQDK